MSAKLAKVDIVKGANQSDFQIMIVIKSKVSIGDIKILFQPKVSPVKLRAKGDKLRVEKVRGERKKRKKNLPTKKQMKNIDLLHQHTTEALQAMEEEQKQSYSNNVSY